MLTVPAVAVTVSLYVPAGVLAVVVVVVGGFVSLLPPPHAVMVRETKMPSAHTVRRDQKRFLLNRNNDPNRRDATPVPAMNTFTALSRCAVVLDCVVTFTAKGWEAPGVRASVVGLIEQVAFCGAPVQANVTFPLKAALPVRVRLNVAGWPLGTVLVTEPPLPGPMLTEGTVPVPVSGIACGLAAALSAIDKVPDSDPTVDGVNTTAI